MHITCERCGTVYALDDRLIPAAGAPVQCTRCGNVFTAKPPQQEYSQEPTRKTMMLFPENAPGPGFDRTPAPAARPAPSVTPPPSDAAKAALGKTMLQFPTPTAPVPQTPKTVRYGSPGSVALPTTTSSPPKATPAVVPETVARPRSSTPVSQPAVRTRTPRPPGVPAIGAQRPQTDAMAKTILHAPAMPISLPGLSQADHAATAEFEKQLQSRGRGVWIAILVGLVVGGTAFAFLTLRNRRPSIPAAAVQAHDDAMRALARDDSASLTAAADQLAQTASQYPTYVPAPADRVIALSFLEADLRDEIQVLDARYIKLDRERESIEKKEETQDWRARVKEKLDAMAAIKAKADPLKDKASDISTKLNEQLKAATQMTQVNAAEDPTLKRAQAVYYAVKGDERAEKLANAYRDTPDVPKTFDDPNRAFADLAVALLGAYGHHTPERVEKGRKAAAAALGKNSALLRAQFCIAKIAFGVKDYPGARSALDALLIQNPKHDAAKLLREETEAAEAAAAKPPAPAPAQ
jgi:predicted Zn finger-like uncharacterized protein